MLELKYRSGGRVEVSKGKKEGQGEGSESFQLSQCLLWFAVPKSEDSFWPNLLLPHRDVLQRPREREIPLGGLHGGAEWQLQVRTRPSLGEEAGRWESSASVLPKERRWPKASP